MFEASMPNIRLLERACEVQRLNSDSREHLAKLVNAHSHQGGNAPAGISVNSLVVTY